MKKKAAISISVLTVILMCVAIFAPFSAATVEKTAPVPENDPVLATRFLNMLNHNSSYNSDFDSVDELVNNAACFLSVRSGSEDEFISEAVVAAYVMDMYGIAVSDTSALNPEFPHKDGCIFVIPRGLTSYSHEFVQAVKNEDGTYTVTTRATVKSHDSQSRTVTATSLFVKSNTSSFGFNLVYCELDGFSEGLAA